MSGISLITTIENITSQAERISGRTIKSSEIATNVRNISLSDPLTSALARNMSSVFHEMLNLGSAGLSALARTNFDELLLNMMTGVIVEDVRTAVGSGKSVTVSGSVVRQAQDYIRAHASEPIRLADVAQRLGLGLRALQLGFRKDLGTSPREYLMQCRLEMARARLLSGDQGIKIAAVAYECGFQDLAIFSRKYRQAFGELPSATLRKR